MGNSPCNQPLAGAIGRKTTVIAALYLGLALAFLAISRAVPALCPAGTAALGAPISLLSVCLALRHLRAASDRYDRLNRLGWLAAAVSSLLFTIGEGLWASHAQFGVHSTLGAAGSALWLTLNPLALVGALLMAAGTRRANLTFLLDCSAGAISSALVLWGVASRAKDRLGAMPPATRLFLTGYPVLGIVSVFAIVLILGLAVRARRDRLALSTLSAAIAVNMLASVLLTTEILQHRLASADLFLAGFFVARALTLIALGQRLDAATTDAIDAPSDLPEALAGNLQSAVPYAIASVSALTAASGQISVLGVKNAPIVLGSVALAGVIVVRQAVALAEHRRLSEALRRAQETLEQDVERRTEMLALRNDQMGTLHNLLVEISESLDELGVLLAAHRHAGEAFRADVVGVWHSPEPEPAPMNLVRLTGLESEPVWKRHVSRIRHAPANLQRVVSRRRRHPGTLHVHFVRLVSQHQSFGMVGIARWNNAFTASDEALIESMGRAVGGALHNARRFAAARDAADRDPMTGLLNHRAIHERLQTLLSEAIQTGGGGAVLMVDVNDFKTFNDTYGHPVGDRVILAVAQALREACPADASLGRYGGDEFFAALPGCDRRRAQCVAAALRDRIAEVKLLVDGAPIPVPLSLAIGISVYPDDSQKALEVLAHADSNLYQAKFGRYTGPERRAAHSTTESSLQILDAMIAAIDSVDQYTRRHSKDVSEHATRLALALDLPADQVERVRVAGLLHDVGKIGMPNDILTKSGVLAPQEFETMRRHPVSGALIVSAMPDVASLAPGIRAHHERWDGRGYPDALTGENIVFEGRLLAIADAFSAMTISRPYRQSRSWDEALDEIEAGAGNQFDPDLAAAFVAANRDRPTLRKAA